MGPVSHGESPEVPLERNGNREERHLWEREMGEGDQGQGTQAERLAQLADLHRDGVLSDEEYEAAVVRSVTGLLPQPDQAERPPSGTIPPPDGRAPVRQAGIGRALDVLASPGAVLRTLGSLALGGAVSFIVGVLL